MAKFSRLVNGGWQCYVDGVRYNFYKPAGFKGDWLCKAYFDSGDEAQERASTREEGIRLLQDVIQDRRIERDEDEQYENDW